jgi:glutathione synthase/RimK-type ligase-like ATP-grasp enzyme
MKPIVYPYKLASQSAKVLAQNLNTKRVRPDGNYKYFSNHLIINFGNHNKPNWAKNGAKILNHWDKISESSNKLTCLNKLKEAGVRTPEFTTDIEVAKQWIKDENIVFCRKLLNSSCGKGIVVARKVEELVAAPLFCKYVNAKHEFRIHVYNDGINEPIIFDAVQKRRKEGFKEGNVENPDANLIRSHNNGHIFCRENLIIPDDVKNQVRKAIKAAELNFAGVDIRFKEKTSEAYVLELNSAVGLEATTLQRYSDLFKCIAHGIKIHAVA